MFSSKPDNLAHDPALVYDFVKKAWRIYCWGPCGFCTDYYFTVEGVGRAFDVHLAAVLPRPSDRNTLGASCS